MSKTLTVRIEDETYAALEERARAQGVTVSQFVRSQLEPRETRTDDPWGDVAPDSIPVFERKVLALLHRILARLVPPSDRPEGRLDPGDDDGEYAYQMARAVALEQGWVEEYTTEFYSLEREMPREESTLVHDILEMFVMLEHSYDALDPADASRLAFERWAVEFSGFDAQKPREARMLTFARRVIADGKWQPLAKYFDEAHERGNSHAPFLDSYLRMLAAFKPIWREKVHGARHGRRPDGYNLTADELRVVVEAGHAR